MAAPVAPYTEGLGKYFKGQKTKMTLSEKNKKRRQFAGKSVIEPIKARSKRAAAEARLLHPRQRRQQGPGLDGGGHRA